VFDYQAFVAELRELVDAPTFGPKGPQFTASPVFKEWKHKLIDLLQRIEAQGYEINCGVRTRHFSPLVYSMVAAPQDRSQRDAEAFFDAVNQTHIELRTVIENFDRYGTQAKKLGHDVPASAPAPVEAAVQSKISRELSEPSKVTATWLWQHVPVSMWVTALGILGATAVGGYTFASTNLGKSLKQLFAPAPETAASMQTAPSPNHSASSPSK